MILSRAEPFGGAAVQRLFRDGLPVRIERGDELLEPFLAKGGPAPSSPLRPPPR